MSRLQKSVWLAVLLALTIDSTNTKGTEMTNEAEMQAMLQRWQEACTPGPAHEKLSPFVGKWDTVTRVWMAGPDQPPAESKGTSVTSWWDEKRWLQTSSDGEMMGQPERGHGVMGYDNYKKKYVATWVSSSTTALLSMEGGFDQSGKTLILYGLMDEPMTGEHDKVVKYIWRLDNPDRIVFEVHDLPIGETNTKVIEMVYTRKQ